MLIQQITPDLMHWIAAQAQAGHEPEVVLEAMCAGGWETQLARAAIDQVKQGRREPPPLPVAVPEPVLASGASTLLTADREVQVLARLHLPRLIVFGNLLDAQECEALIELAQPRLARSQVGDNWSGSGRVDDCRSSQGMFFERGAHEVVRHIEARIAQLSNWPVERGEGLQVLRYGPGAQYQPHHDYFDPTVPGSGADTRGGRRVATLLMYLRSPRRGGTTIFPETGLEIAPVRGNAVFFSYDRAHPITRTLHGGAPVHEGEKWVATKWLREGEVS